MVKHATRPPNYHRPLTQDSSGFRQRMEQELDKIDKEIDYLNANRSVEGMKKLFKLKAKQRRVELDLEYQGADPKKIPVKELREIANDPVPTYDPIENDYRKRIKNRATAIRAYCVACMGGNTSYVRTCPSVTCVLWPFRMGKDPFRGFDIPKMHIELDNDDTELDADFEEGDDDNDADASE